MTLEPKLVRFEDNKTIIFKLGKSFAHPFVVVILRLNGVHFKRISISSFWLCQSWMDSRHVENVKSVRFFCVHSGCYQRCIEMHGKWLEIEAIQNGLRRVALRLSHSFWSIGMAHKRHKARVSRWCCCFINRNTQMNSSKIEGQRLKLNNTSHQLLKRMSISNVDYSIL